jgi:hypothetical protein
LFAGIEKIEVHGNSVFRSWLLPGQQSIYHPVSTNQFFKGSTNRIGLVEAEDPLEGPVLYTENSVLKPISGLRVFGQLSLIGIWLAMMITGLFIFIIHTFLYAIYRKKYSKFIRISALPAITSIFIILTFFLRYHGFDNADLLLSKPSFLAISLLCTSILFVVGAVASAIVIYKSKRYKLYKLVQYPLIILTFLHILMSIYLVFYGFIPLITWT